MRKRSVIALAVVLAFLSLANLSLFAQSGAVGRKKISQVYVTFNANVKGARVYVGKYQGYVPFRVKLTPGLYSVRVTAPGYITFTGKINITSKNYQNINITLQPLSVYVSISTMNVKGARLYLNNHYKGTTPANIRLVPGSYTIRIEANGFLPYQGVLNVTTSQRQNYSFTLQPAMATLNVIVPYNYINSKIKNAKRLIKIWVDKRLINPNGEIRNLQIAPGMHTITLESGGLVTTGEFNLQSGQVYNIQLSMQLLMVQ